MSNIYSNTIYIKNNKPVRPHTHVLTDITYIYTINNVWTYLLSFMDQYTRKILAWDLSQEMRTKWVVSITKQLVSTFKTIIYIHSDQGSQYTSKQYLKYLLENGISSSFNSKGYPYHNPWIESFHAQLKKEYIYRRNLKDARDTKAACFNYIDIYNTIRSHKCLKYKSPNEYELEWNNLKAA